MRKNLERKTLLMFAVIALPLILLQAGSVSSAEPQVGATRGGISVWHEVAGVGLLNITPEVAKVGETVLYNYTAHAPFNLGLNLTIKFENDEGYLDYVEVFKNVRKTATLANVSTQQLFNPSNASFYNVTTVNTSILTTFVKEWVATPTVKYGIGSDYYYTAKFVTGEQVRYKPKAKVYGGIIKYDVTFHPSNLNATQPTRIEIDPLLNATAANITSNTDLNFTACQPNCARFTPPTDNLVLAAGNGSNLSDWDTFSDNNFAGWTLFNRSNLGGCGSNTRISANQGSLNITSEQVGSGNCFATAWILTNHSINNKSGIVMTAKINTSLMPSVSQAVMCYVIEYDKIANSSSGNPPSCYGTTNAGFDGAFVGFDGTTGYQAFTVVDAAVTGSSASPGSSNKNSVETWRWYFNCTHSQFTINEVPGEGVVNESVIFPHSSAELCAGGAFGLQLADNAAGVNRAMFDNISIANASVFGSPFNLSGTAKLQTNVLNTTITATTVRITNITANYANTAASWYVFDATHKNLQSVTEGNNNAITSIIGVGINATFAPNNIQTATELTSILVEWSPQAAPSNAPNVNVSILNSTSSNSTASLASEQLFSNVNFSDADFHQEVNSTFKWFINNTNQSWGGGNRTAELKAMIYKDAVLYMHLDENGGGVNYSDSSGQHWRSSKRRQERFWHNQRRC